MLKQCLKNFGRTVRRTALGAAGAVPITILAAGAMAATGDPSKAVTAAVAAGMAGSNITNYYGDKLAKASGNAGKTAKTAFWGGDQKKLDQFKYDKEFKENADNIDKLTKILGTRTAAKKAMKDGSVQALLNNNVTDPSKIGKAIRLRDNYIKKGMDKDQALNKAVAMAKWNRDANPGIYAPMSNEQIRWKSNMLNKLTAQGYDKTQASHKVDEILEDLESFES